jgi:hypothetical protein
MATQEIHIFGIDQIGTSGDIGAFGNKEIGKFTLGSLTLWQAILAGTNRVCSVVWRQTNFLLHLCRV